MEKKFVKVGQLKEGNYVLIDGFACRIIEIEKSKPGKHGSAKARITAIDIFSENKRTLLEPTGSNAEVPIIKRSNAQVVAVMGDTLSLMDTASYEAFNCPAPKDVPGIKAGDEVEYLQLDEQVRILRKK